MKRVILVLVFAISLLYSANKEKEIVISNEVEVTGMVVNKLKLDVKELEKMSYKKSEKTPLVCMSGETKDNASYEGVLLRDIIDKAIIDAKSKSDYNKAYILVKSTDGYQTIFSYNEIFNTNLGDNIIVFYKRNGEYLDKHQGKIALISIDDIKNGPRHIKWLEKIIIGKI